jgi:hypothetical protein
MAHAPGGSNRSGVVVGYLPHPCRNNKLETRSWLEMVEIITVCFSEGNDEEDIESFNVRTPKLLPEQESGTIRANIWCGYLAELVINGKEQGYFPFPSWKCIRILRG